MARRDAEKTLRPKLGEVLLCTSGAAVQRSSALRKSSARVKAVP